MKQREAGSREEAVEVAREIVTKYYDSPYERAWLVASPPDSYKELRYRAEVHVREGSPPKGYVLVGYGFVLGLDNTGAVLCRVGFPP